MILKKRIHICILAMLLFVALDMPMQFVHAQEPALLTVKGDLLPNQAFKLSDLEKLPRTEITDSYTIERNQQREARKNSYRGVLLRDLLQSSGLKEKSRNDFRRTLIITKARDGFIGLFTWAELFNTKAGDNVLIIYEMNGKPLTSNEGPLSLRSFGDFKPGTRHVKWLEQIKVVEIRQ